MAMTPAQRRRMLQRTSPVEVEDTASDKAARLMAEARRDGNWSALRRAAWAAGEAGGDEAAWRAAIADAAAALEPLPPVAWLDEALAVARRARAARRWRR